jgi:tetratricopeptide (TPR) repeat protein
MSPEQASGAKLLDERTDIYSLGVTLYELAALRPAFAETDRQRLIHQVVEHEPPLLRAINPRVPQDLQSIVLKAMAKDAVDRYRSAGDLVGELRRFLKGEPVQAKKPTLWQQSVKWCRRHPAWVSALVATCLIVILVLSVATMFVLQSRATALAEQERAEANLELARRAIDQMYARVAGDYAMDRPRSVSLQRDILERALPFYEELSQANRQSLVPLRDRGRALVNVSYICRYLDQFDRAESAAREAADVFDQLIKQSDSTVSDWKDLGRALIYQAYALGNSRGRGEEAFAGTRRAVDVLAEGLRRYPHDVECRDELARRTNDMANGLVYRHRYDEAEQAYQRVTELIAQIGDPAGASSRYRRTRAYHAKDFGVFLIGRRPRQAETMMREAVKLFEELLPDDFGDRWDLQYLNHSRLGLARLLEQTGREDEAAPVRQQAVKDAVQLADDNPRVLHFRADVLKILRSQLNDSLTRNDYGAAEVVCRQIIDHQQKLAISAPDHPLEEALAGSHKQLETIRAMKQSTSPTEER